MSDGLASTSLCLLISVMDRLHKPHLPNRQGNAVITSSSPKKITGNCLNTALIRNNGYNKTNNSIHYFPMNFSLRNGIVEIDLEI